MADQHCRSSRLRRTFWRKIKEAFTSRSLPPINCKPSRVLLGTPSTSTPIPDKDESPISPISPISPVFPVSPLSPLSPVFSVSPLPPVFSDNPHDNPPTSPTDRPKRPKSPPVERAWYADASLSSSFARKEQSRRESTPSSHISSPISSLETIHGRSPHHTSTLRAISTPYLFPFPSTEPTARCSTGRIWEQVAEVGSQEGNHPG